MIHDPIQVLLTFSLDWSFDEIGLTSVTPCLLSVFACPGFFIVKVLRQCHLFKIDNQGGGRPTYICQERRNLIGQGPAKEFILTKCLVIGAAIPPNKIAPKPILGLTI